MQYLYIIKCNEYHKIGIANDVESRLAQLSTGNPYVLEVQAVYEFQNAEVVERSIHQRFSDKRKRGEWFDLNLEDLRDVGNICLMLGGKARDYAGDEATEESIEEAEESCEYQPTIEDVKRIMADYRYTIEPRFDKGMLRGYFWRTRRNGVSGSLYVGRRNPIFDEVCKLLNEGEK